MIERKYCILPNLMLTTIDWEDFQNTLGSCPKFPGHFIVVFVGDTPPSIAGHDVFTSDQILAKKKDLNDPVFDDPTFVDNIIPPEQTRYAIAPFSDWGAIDFSEEGILGQIPVRVSLDSTLIAIAYDGDKSKPQTLLEYNDFSNEETRVEALDPNSNWYIPWTS